MVEALNYVFLVCIGVGLGIPLLSVLLGLFGSLVNADFGGGHSADLGGADIGSADLGGIDLGGADLGGVDLGGADLGGVDLGGADLGGIDLGGADLGGVDLDLDFSSTDAGGSIHHGIPAAGGKGAGTGHTVPLNFMCLCFSLVVFGAIGRLLLPLMSHPLLASVLLIVLLAVSFGAYLLIYRSIVKPLQQNNPRVLRQWDIFGSKGKLTLRITAEDPGTVSLKDSTGAMISYRATAKRDVLELWDGVIPQGTDVVVVDLDPGAKLAYVRPLDTFENHSLKYIK